MEKSEVVTLDDEEMVAWANASVERNVELEKRVAELEVMLGDQMSRIIATAIRGAVEHISIQGVSFTCGVCNDDYQVELHDGDLQMVTCPKCQNSSLQMVRGTS